MGDLTIMGGQAAERQKRRFTRKHLRYYGVVLAFLSPWLIGFLTFYLYPTLASLYFSFTHYDLLTSPRWVGLANYRFMFTDPQFWQSLRNTLWMVVFATPIQIAFAIGCALVLTRVKRGAGVFRTIFFVPDGGGGSAVDAAILGNVLSIFRAEDPQPYLENQVQVDEWGELVALLADGVVT